MQCDIFYMFSTFKAFPSPFYYHRSHLISKLHERRAEKYTTQSSRYYGKKG